MRNHFDFLSSGFAKSKQGIKKNSVAYLDFHLRWFLSEFKLKLLQLTPLDPILKHRLDLLTFHIFMKVGHNAAFATPYFYFQNSRWILKIPKILILFCWDWDFFLFIQPIRQPQQFQRQFWIRIMIRRVKLLVDILQWLWIMQAEFVKV